MDVSGQPSSPCSTRDRAQHVVERTATLARSNGTMRLLASRRTDADGERQLREFQERGRHLFAHHFGSLAATAADVDETSPIPTARRCVRPAYRTAVTDE